MNALNNPLSVLDLLHNLSIVCGRVLASGRWESFGLKSDSPSGCIDSLVVNKTENYSPTGAIGYLLVTDVFLTFAFYINGFCMFLYLPVAFRPPGISRAPVGSFRDLGLRGQGR